MAVQTAAAIHQEREVGFPKQTAVVSAGWLERHSRREANREKEEKMKSVTISPQQPDKNGGRNAAPFFFQPFPKALGSDAIMVSQRRRSEKTAARRAGLQ